MGVVETWRAIVFSFRKGSEHLTGDLDRVTAAWNALSSPSTSTRLNRIIIGRS